MRRRPNGKLSIEVFTSGLPRVRTATLCRVEAIVFLNRGGGSSGLQPLSREDGIYRCLSAIPLFAPHVRNAQQECLRALFAAPAYELTYRDTSDALPQLDRLL